MPLDFHRNDWPSLGVEVELQLVDKTTLELSNAYEVVHDGVPQALRDSVKPELLRCYLEINSKPCRTVSEIESDLSEKVDAVVHSASEHGIRVFWGATHPFSRWQQQEITPNPRYYMLAERLKETLLRPVTFGMHVHVGVPSGEAAIRASDRLLPFLPMILALSCNSPFFNARATGLHSNRVELLEGLPNGGLPPEFGSWDAYVRLFDQLKNSDSIQTSHELWWDARINTELGTLEVRVCDLPANLPSALGLTALIQCLVWSFAFEETGKTTWAPEMHQVLIRQNRWRAARFGMGAEFVDPWTLRPVAARDLLAHLIDHLMPAARQLGCVAELTHAAEMVRGHSGAEQQLALFDETGDLTEVVRRLSVGG
ncbi:YbdK family carboxylate-amine ligase [Isosphaeraceae bacterium EP7]